MTLQFGDRTSGDGSIGCRRCGHSIVLRGGDHVPRCYCGGEEFEELASRPRERGSAPRSPPPEPPRGDPPH